MATKRAGLLFLLALGFGLAATRAYADPESILGKWLMKAETPQGPMDLQLELKEDNGKLVGTVVVFDSTVAVTGLKFEEPQLEMQLPVFDGNYKVTGVLKENKLSGTWEQVGGDMKGTWTAEKSAGTTASAAAAPIPAALDGTWNAIAGSPSGNLAFALELKQSGNSFEGKALAGGGSIPLAKGKFVDNTMSFEIEYEGGTYKVEGTLAGDKITGKWSSLDGADSGAFSAERQKS
jgi:hypothetical protein